MHSHSSSGYVGQTLGEEIDRLQEEKNQFDSQKVRVWEDGYQETEEYLRIRRLWGGTVDDILDGMQIVT